MCVCVCVCVQIFGKLFVESPRFFRDRLSVEPK